MDALTAHAEESVRRAAAAEAAEAGSAAAQRVGTSGHDADWVEGGMVVPDGHFPEERPEVSRYASARYTAGTFGTAAVM